MHEIRNLAFTAIWIHYKIPSQIKEALYTAKQTCFISSIQFTYLKWGIILCFHFKTKLHAHLSNCMLYITFLCYQVLVFFKSEINNVQITFFPIFYVPKRLILYDENIKTYINNIDFFEIIIYRCIQLVNSLGFSI